MICLSCLELRRVREFVDSIGDNRSRGLFVKSAIWSVLGLDGGSEEDRNRLTERMELLTVTGDK